MNKKMNFLLVSFFATALTFCYLAFHHYSLMFGLTASSLCQVSQTINCDAAALSSYSEFIGIPIAVFGVWFEFILFLILFSVRIQWLDITPMISITFRLLTSLAAVISIGLGAVSVFKLGVICPFCFLSYILNFINVVLVFSLFKTKILRLNFSDFLDHKGFFTTLALVPFLSWFTAATIQTQFGYDEILKIIPEKISQWKQMPVQHFNLELGLIKGDLSSQNSLVEFADFKCPHCKAAAETVKNFEKLHPKIKFIFKPFPLDGQCNQHVSFKGDGSRCQMAGLVLCSEKYGQHGWVVHDYFFENQEKFSQVSDLIPDFKNFAADILKINSEVIIKCSQSSETYELIRKMADEAKLALVEGTPALFMNQQKLGYGQFLPILKEAYKNLH